MTDNSRARHVAENEGVVRLVNERVEELAEQLHVKPDFICECARIDCSTRLAVPISDYEAVRSAGARFIVAAGHEEPQYEKIVDDRGDWVVVEKTGAAGDAAERDHPRNP